MYYEEPKFDERVKAYAEEHSLDVGKLDWHLEADHGWERHDVGYGEAISGAATCVIFNRCEGKPVWYPYDIRN